MTQNEKVTVKLTLEMDVKTALTTFDGCKTAKDVVDCMVEELKDQFVGTGSGLTITDAAIIDTLDGEMPVEDAITQLKMDRDLCNFNPMTGEEEPMNEDCRKSAAALDIAIKALERMSCKDVINKKLAIEQQERYMTIDYLKKMQEEYVEGEGYERHSFPEWYALNVAIKVLQETVPLAQESCKDAISREAVIQWLENATDDSIEHAIDSNLGFIPSVTPIYRTGEWKSDGHGHIFCTACGETNVSSWKSKCCPCCGANMKTKIESEGK